MLLRDRVAFKWFLLITALCWSVTPALAISLSEFEAAMKADTAADAKVAVDAVIRTGSPEFMVRASRALPEKETAGHPDGRFGAYRQSLLRRASLAHPLSHVQRYWIAEAQYDLGMEYVQLIPRPGAEKNARLLLEAATSNGHDGAPAALASLIKRTDRARAETLVRLSIARGDPLAEEALDALQRDYPMERSVVLP